VNGRFYSKTVAKWLRTFGIASYSSSRKIVNYYKTIPRTYNIEELFSPIKGITEYPVIIGMHFVRNSKHKWDFNNATHIILDLMTALDIIPDDSVDYIFPVPMSINGIFWSYNKENPGVYINIL